MQRVVGERGLEGGAEGRRERRYEAHHRHVRNGVQHRRALVVFAGPVVVAIGDGASALGPRAAKHGRARAVGDLERERVNLLARGREEAQLHRLDRGGEVRVR